MSKYEILKKYLEPLSISPNEWAGNGLLQQVSQAMIAYHLEQKRLEELNSSEVSNGVLRIERGNKWYNGTVCD